MVSIKDNKQLTKVVAAISCGGLLIISRIENQRGRKCCCITKGG